ncbi:MAG TPA: DUF916 domain-containing protein [Gaiellaceae bacterium]|nr:DUF916 domain-containing protein [Gaiellaceae bacterium]
MWLRFSAVLAALLCGAAAAVPAVAGTAAQQASFAVKPVTYDPALDATKSYFILKAKPGDVIADKVRIVNTGTATGTAFLYPVDATTGQTSGAVYLSRQSPRHDVGAWVRINRPQVTLRPGASTIVGFTIRVPRSIRPGDHLGGIVAENSQIQSGSGKGALQIRIKHLTIAAVELQLPGKVVASAQVTSVKAGGQHGYQYVYLHLTNPGTIMIKPAGTLVVKSAGGAVVMRRPLQLDTFLPQTSIDYPVLLPARVLPPGSYTGTVTLHTSGQAVVGYRKSQGAPFSVTHSFPFTVTSGERTQVYSGAAAVTPPSSSKSSGSKSKLTTYALYGLAALLLIAIVLVALLLLWRPRRKDEPAAPAPQPVVGPEAATIVAAPVPAPVEAEEEPGWAGLLRAYDPGPRPTPDFWREDEPAETFVDPIPLEPAPDRTAPEPEPVVAIEPVVEPEPVAAAAAELDHRQLRDLIVSHDLDEARAYLRSGDVPPAMAPEPAQTRSRVDSDVSNLSSALLEASLIALAALLATRLIKGTE